MISGNDIQQHSRSTEPPVQTDTECSASDDDQAPMVDDEDRAADKIFTDNTAPQHKLCSNSLDDILVNTRVPKTINSSLPTSRSFQERKALFIEQARRFVKHVLKTVHHFLCFTENSYRNTAVFNELYINIFNHCMMHCISCS